MSTSDTASAPVNAAPAPLANRIESMDQFRGYTVAGMFLVNFLGGYAAIHSVFKHNNTFLSYADTIMPSFMFACGFSYRLSFLRRAETWGKGVAVRHAIVRSLALVLISLMAFGFGNNFKSFDQISTETVRDFVAKVLKADLWETLAIIGVAQLVILPVVARGVFARLFTIVLFLVGHGVMTYYFNYNFVHGFPSLLDDFWGISKSRCWDGGFFGVIMWSVPMLAGTLAYDAMIQSSPGKASFKLIFWGSLLMILGYGASCLTRLYDVTPEKKEAMVAATKAKAKDAVTKVDNAKKAVAEAKDDARKKAEDDLKAAEAELKAADAAVTAFKVPEHADSPVLPDIARAQAMINDGKWKDLLAEVPFLEPPPSSERQLNYWMMGKRIVSPSFVLYATGYSLALLGVFVIFVDAAGLRIGLFRTLGRNALAAYLVHHHVEQQIHSIVPKDSPFWYVMVGLAVFYVISYGFIRWLEAQKVFIRL